MVTTVEGGPQGQKLVERHAERINVGSLVDDPSPGQGLLGAHVTERTDHVAGMSQAEITGKPRQSEIGDPERTIRVDQQVGRLDVAMEDAQTMGVVKCIGRLSTKSGDVAAIVLKDLVFRSIPARRRGRWFFCRSQADRRSA